jgi:hypothetical protein
VDNFFELLLPLLFVGIYFLTNLLGRKKGGGESEERSGEQAAPGENADELRRIREELKRKMRERRGESAAGESRPVGEATTAERAGPEEREGGAVLRESHPKRSRGMRESRQRKMGGEGGEENEETRTGTAPSPAPTPAGPSPVPSPVDRQWNERMAEIRRTQEEAERIRREAGAQGLPPYHDGVGGARSRRAGALPTAATYREFLRASLAEPYNLRRSFLLSEVFGTPLGLRENNRTRPSWEQ